MPRLTSILIGGSEYVSLAQAAATQKQQGLNGEIGTCTVWLLSPPNPFTEEFTPEFGPTPLTILNSQEVIITQDGGARWFAGYVSRVSLELMGVVAVLYKLECQDYSVRLEEVIRDAALFTSRSNRDIIRELFATWLPEINTDDVQHIETIPRAEYKAGVTLMSIMQNQHELIGGHFFVDYYKRLKNFTEGSIVAPFYLDESATGLTGYGGALFGEDSLFGGDTLFGGEAVGGLPSIKWLRAGMRYERESSQLKNRVTVRGQYDPDTTAFVDAAISTAARDGYAQQEKSPTWPPIIFTPSEGNSANSNELTALAKAERYTSDGFIYYRSSVIYLEFDTSGIPDDAVIESASLQITGSLSNPDRILYGIIALVGVQYITPQAIFGSLYSHESGNDAYGYDTPVFTFAPGSSTGIANLPLKNLSSINKTGLTAFRICLQMSGAPIEQNYLSLVTREASATASLLHIGYRVVGTRIQVTEQDTESIDEIAGGTDDGVRSAFILDPDIRDEETARLRANYHLSQYSQPKTSGSLAILRQGLAVGQVVRINSPSLSFDETHLITRTQENWFGGSTYLTLTGIEFGQHRPGIEQLLKRMQRALSEQGALS